jgi:hypothetical protein
VPNPALSSQREAAWNERNIPHPASRLSYHRPNIRTP